MKKIFKNSLFTFFLGAIIFSGISVFATLTYNANQITYTKGNNTMYLSEAIDELYTTEDTTITNLQGQIIEKNETITSLNNQLRATLNLKLKAQSASAKDGIGSLSFDDNPWLKNYNHLKFVSVSKDTNCSKRCDVYYSKRGVGSQKMTAGDIVDVSTVFSVFAVSQSNTDGTYCSCVPYFQLYY